MIPSPSQSAAGLLVAFAALPMLGCGPSENELALQKSNQALTQENAERTTELENARRALSETREVLDQAQRELETTRASAAGLEREKNELAAAGVDMRGRLTELEARTTALRTALETETETAKHAAARIALLETEGAQQKERLQTAAQTRRDDQSRLATYQRELAATAAAQDQADQLRGANTHLEELVQSLRQELASARKEHATANTERSRALEQARTLSARIGQLEQDSARCQEALATQADRLRVYQAEIVSAHRQTQAARDQCAETPTSPPE